jgi:LacI family transcriptional regulator
MAVNQKQIAEKLGVSIALVSRVLSGKAAEIGIAPETIGRVLKTAEEMGYVPSAAALSLKGKSTRTIGVTVYDFNDPFFGALIKQIQIEAHKNNYSLVLAGFLNRTPDEKDLQSLYKYALDGLIVIGTDFDATWLKKFQNLPIARIGHGGPEEQSVRVTVDEDQAANLLMSHIRENGRKHPLYIAADLPAHRFRKAAFERAAKNHSINLRTCESTERNAFKAGRQMARDLNHQVDALLCATDQVAMGALHSLHAAGITVPDQISITGFDDIDAAEQFIPAITTLRQPIKEIVHCAFKALLKSQPEPEVLLPGKLITRLTT